MTLPKITSTREIVVPSQYIESGAHFALKVTDGEVTVKKCELKGTLQYISTAKLVRQRHVIGD